MISNYILRNKIELLLKEKGELGFKKNSLGECINAFGISKNAAFKARRGLTDKIEPALLEEREKIARELQAIERRILTINAELNRLYGEQDSDKNKMLMAIFKELFTAQQLEEILNEAKRRMKGESPFRLNFGVTESITAKEAAATYKKIAKEQIDKMIEFRIMLTKVIEDGCSKFDQGEFLKIVSPLNRLIIPLQELAKIKLKNHL